MCVCVSSFVGAGTFFSCVFKARHILFRPCFPSIIIIIISSPYTKVHNRLRQKIHVHTQAAAKAMGSSQSSHYSAKDLTVPEEATHDTTGRKLTLTFAYGSRKGFLSQSAGGKRSHFLLSRPKNLKKENQDSVLCRACLGENPSFHLFGVFDGHGNEGHFCSQYVRDHFEEFLSHALREKVAHSSSSSSSPSWQEACLQGRISPEKIADALKQSFLRANQVKLLPFLLHGPNK